jgi:hypothetical protein
LFEITPPDHSTLGSQSAALIIGQHQAPAIALFQEDSFSSSKYSITACWCLRTQLDVIRSRPRIAWKPIIAFAF